MKSIPKFNPLVAICGSVAAAFLIFGGTKYLLSNAATRSGISAPFEASASGRSISASVRVTAARASKSETARISRTSGARGDEKSSSRTAPSVKTAVKKDYSVFDDCAFLGNSRLIALRGYGLVKNVYAAVGLTVDTVFTKSEAGSDAPVIDELNGKNFKRIYLMFGDNECGWPNIDAFIRKYAKVVEAARERVPDAEIYLQSVLPISAKESAKNEFGCNNDVINNLNKRIKRLADDEGVAYIEPALALKNSDGALPPDAASDGVHLRKKACVIWLNYLVDNF